MEHDMIDMKAFVLLLVPLSFLVFLIGMVKPKWVLFWMKNPDRLWASTLGLLLFMGSWTLYSEMTMKHRPAGQAHEQERPRSPEQQNELQLDRVR
jgi:hypothetical protein